MPITQYSHVHLTDMFSEMNEVLLILQGIQLTACVARLETQFWKMDGCHCELDNFLMPLSLF